MDIIGWSILFVVVGIPLIFGIGVPIAIICGIWSAIRSRHSCSEHRISAYDSNGNLIAWRCLFCGECWKPGWPYSPPVPVSATPVVEAKTGIGFADVLVATLVAHELTHFTHPK